MKTRVMFAAALVALMAGAAGAQAPAKLPTVQQVFDAYAKAVGGRAAWDKVTDRAETGKADIVFAGVTGSYARYYAAPNKMRLTIDLGKDVGKVEQGTDGATVWQGQPDGSRTKMAEPDATYMIEANATGAAFLDATRFTKATVETQEDFDGVACYKVPITTKAGRERIDFFEVATGLRRGQVVMTLAGLQRTVWRDYKAFEGKLVPTTQILTNPQGDIVITVTNVTFMPNDPGLFALPPGIAK